MGSVSVLSAEDPPSSIFPPHAPSMPIDVAAQQTALQILDIIGRYRMPGRKASHEDEGRLRFLAVIYGHVKAQRPIPMCLPAFPFKSPNAIRKVMGKLPDKAEEFALAHLNGLCLAIGDVYPHGARLTIISDGLVYNGGFIRAGHATLHYVVTNWL